MSLQACGGTNIGFPMKLNQNIFDKWTGSADANIDKIIAPMDFSVAWAPSSNQSQPVKVTVSDSFDIDIQNIANNTTLTLGEGVVYNCVSNLSLVQIQHGALSQDKSATQEVILSFTINNKAANPSSPHVILFCRPVVLYDGTNEGSSFWSKVNESAKTGNAIANAMKASDIQSIYAYNSNTMMPMITYDTCIATQLKGSGVSPLTGSLNVRVHVIPYTLYIPSVASGTGKCTNINKYIFTSRIINIFNQSGYNTAQFNIGLNTFPTNSNNNLKALAPSSQITTWSDIEQKFEYLVPEDFLGKSAADIAKMKSLPESSPRKKQYKCYTINPEKDIKNGQILVDPSTGESLDDAQKRALLDSAGGDASLALALAGGQAQNSGIQPGDVESIAMIVISTIGGILLLIYLYHIFNLFITSDPGKWTHLLAFIGLFLILFSLAAYLSKDPNLKK
jgi:hypothetical protein